MQGRPAKLKKGWVGKSFAEKPFNETLYALQQNAIHAAEKGMLYTNQLSVARKGFPRPDFCFFMGCAPSTGVGTSREATYHGRLLSGNSQDAPPGSRGEGSILASMAASRSRESRDGGRAWPGALRSMQANALPAGAVPLLQAAPKRDGLTSTIRVQKARLKP
jgi:hypothetical protein